MTNTDATLLRMVRDRLATMLVPDRLEFMHRMVAGYCLECGVLEVPGKLCACLSGLPGASSPESNSGEYDINDPWPFPWSKPMPTGYDTDGPVTRNAVDFTIGQAWIQVQATGADGLHTGRDRYSVLCLTCEKVLHHNTTGTSTRILHHLVEAHGRKRP
jgi:hypothetical protein